MYAAEYTVTPYGVAIPRVVIDVPATRDVRLPRTPWHLIPDAEVMHHIGADMPAGAMIGGRV